MTTLFQSAAASLPDGASPPASDISRYPSLISDASAAAAQQPFGSGSHRRTSSSGGGGGWQPPRLPRSPQSASARLSGAVGCPNRAGDPAVATGGDGAWCRRIVAAADDDAPPPAGDDDDPAAAWQACLDLVRDDQRWLAADASLTHLEQRCGCSRDGLVSRFVPEGQGGDAHESATLAALASALARHAALDRALGDAAGYSQASKAPLQVRSCRPVQRCAVYRPRGLHDVYSERM